MSIVTVSSRYRIVIPKAVRESLGLRPGQEVQVLAFDGRVQLIPLQPIEAARGFVRGIDTTVDRDHDRSHMARNRT
ncbi:MAG: AbrB/MazE/SpoVT family DNA-binding domain-containing protein [Gemmatimonadota bacterium]|uniref:AbrB/MazE/SpoVT family DNA-binding domain-containing protein n=1 Tax=Candidatus Palauibacter scopulicola TaxID=3056741 RepID=UPI0023A58451|nr:AbrB/MazE/SpoVT family DNA-binding domain-containing protein [Candidatus Palauibacter scopulicola]